MKYYCICYISRIYNKFLHISKRKKYNTGEKCVRDWDLTGVLKSVRLLRRLKKEKKSSEVILDIFMLIVGFPGGSMV